VSRVYYWLNPNSQTLPTYLLTSCFQPEVHFQWKKICKYRKGFFNFTFVYLYNKAVWLLENLLYSILIYLFKVPGALAVPRPPLLYLGSFSRFNEAVRASLSAQADNNGVSLLCDKWRRLRDARRIELYCCICVLKNKIHCNIRDLVEVIFCLNWVSLIIETFFVVLVNSVTKVTKMYMYL